jgi:hypothetical protein
MADNDQAAASKAMLEADKKRQDEVRKKVADERSAREKAGKEAPSSANVKPTPTQEENDLAASGVYLPEHEADGSPEEKIIAQTLDKDSKTRESKPATTHKGDYQTKTL